VEGFSWEEESSEPLFIRRDASYGDRRVQNHCLSDGKLLMGRGEFRTIALAMGGFSWGEER